MGHPYFFTLIADRGALSVLKWRGGMEEPSLERIIPCWIGNGSPSAGMLPCTSGSVTESFVAEKTGGSST